MVGNYGRPAQQASDSPDEGGDLANPSNRPSEAPEKISASPDKESRPTKGLGAEKVRLARAGGGAYPAPFIKWSDSSVEGDRGASSRPEIRKTCGTVARGHAQQWQALECLTLGVVPCLVHITHAEWASQVPIKTRAPTMSARVSAW